jgi:hypothetical protein
MVKRQKFTAEYAFSKATVFSPEEKCTSGCSYSEIEE